MSTHEELDTTPGPTAPPPLRRNRDFQLLWVSAACSILATRVGVLVWPLLVLWHGGTPAQAGLVAFGALLPQFVVPLPAGVLVDRWDRRSVMVTCDVVGIVAVGSVVAALVVGDVSVSHLMVVAFVESAIGIVYLLSERAAVRALVPPGQLPTALARNEARGRATTLVGQPAGTALLGLARYAPLLLSMVGHVLSLVGLLLVRGRMRREDAPPRAPMRSELAVGLRWLWGNRVMRTAISVIAGTNVAFQALTLSLAVTLESSGHQPLAFGVLGVGAGVGGIAGAISASWWMRRLRFSVVFIGAVACWALLIPVMSLTTEPVLLAGVYALICAVAAISNVMGGVYQVSVTPEHLQGRVSSVAGLVSSGANSTGPLLGGVLLGTVGAPTTIRILGAVAGLLAVLALLSPAIRGMRLPVVPDGGAGI